MIPRVFVATACLVVSSSCFASATGKPHWSRVDLTEQTHLGEMRVLAETKVVSGRRVLGKLNIWMGGRRLRIPSTVNLRIDDPQLHDIEVIYTASTTCIDDDCPRVADYPVWLRINFGETFRRTPDDKKAPTCEDSTLTIDVFADRIGYIDKTVCSETSETSASLYDPKVPARATKSEEQKNFEEDPRGLVIDASRWEYIVEKSNAGLDLVEQKSAPEWQESDYRRGADWALKDDALHLLLLRNRLHQMGLLKEKDAQATDWPLWILETPSSDETPDTLIDRLVWISDEATKLTDIGCKIGEKKSDDMLFCSVE